MKTVGLITEYNPFHNGHLHHLRESLRVAGADVSVAVMSGHFLQRGEAALVDKWCRAQMALQAGVDLVVELPLPWACSSAPDFAAGGVKALNALGGIDALCFGSESGELEPLQKYAATLLEHEDEVEHKTALLLKNGLTYPQARAQVLEQLLPPGSDVEGLASPNNILGIAYLKALSQTGSNMKALTIKRIGAGFHDAEVKQGQIASATGIRRCLKEGEGIDGLMPDAVTNLLNLALSGGNSCDSGRYFTALMAQIFSQAESLDRYWLVDNGIDNRLRTEADLAVDLESLIDAVKTRQVTRTRIQRMLTAILLGLERGDAGELINTGPRYLHLLAASEKGQAYIAATRKQRELPLIQNFSRVYATLKRFYGKDSKEYDQALKQLHMELKATRIYTLLMAKPWQAERNRDFYQPLIRRGDAR